MGGTIDGEIVRLSEHYETRIKQLERLNATLSAEVDAQRPVVEACQAAVRNGLISPNSGFTVSKIYHAVTAYEAVKEPESGDSQHVADTQGPPTPMGRVGGIPIMKLNDGKRR